MVHYSAIQISKPRNLTKVTESRYSQLITAKNARIKLGGAYLHQPQCDNVPNLFVEGLAYHQECYKQFTRAISDLNKRDDALSSEKSPVSSSSASARPKRCRETDSGGRFPSYCMICKKVEKRIRTKDTDVIEHPSKFTLESREQLFKKAVVLCNDKTMSDAISGVKDLKVKDFRKHESCIKTYTSIVRDDNTGASHEQDEYDLVRQTIDETVIKNGICVPMDTLLELKGIEKKDSQNRRNMKSYLQRKYGNKIVFLSTESNKGQLVMSIKCLEDVSRGEKAVYNAVPLNDDTALCHAANVLRRMIIEYTDGAESLPWPPTVESLEKRLASTPTLLIEFFRTLLAPEHSHHVVAESTKRLAESLSQDLIFAITKGTFLTFKHTALGLGLHNMVGQKIPIVILSHLGQCIMYHTVREIETAQAELSEQFSKNDMTLPIQPKDSGSYAPTIFWWDNFDRFIDTGTGGGSIHNTPGIAFQEQSADTLRRQESSINRSKRTSLANEQGPPLKRFKIDPKKNPAIFSAGSDGSSDSEGVSYSSNVLYLWKILRKINEKDQLYSKFCGFVIDLIKTEQKRTVMTYLPPIETPITNYGTLFEMFYRSEKMAAQGNMKYTHITLDCGAAMKAYHVLWNNPDRFKHIIIHLGDFHTMQAHFGAIGSYVSGSGFEDIIYQLGLCQPGTKTQLGFKNM